MNQRQKILSRIRIVFAGMALGIALLAAESLITGREFFLFYAGGLSVFTLIIVSLMVARAVKTED